MPARLAELRDLLRYITMPGGLRLDIRQDVYVRQMEGSDWPLTESLIANLAWLIEALECIMLDHEWVDCSSAGPESGDIDLRCRRCGYHVHHQLY